MRPTRPRLSSNKEAKARYAAPLPREHWADQPFVWDGSGRLIAPWPTHGVATPQDLDRLSCVLDFVRAARLDGPCWVWPEREQPQPVECEGDARAWVRRWAQGRACYVAQQRR